jgi:hypothetical protein
VQIHFLNLLRNQFTQFGSGEGTVVI